MGVHRERLEILEPLVNKVKLVNLEEEDQEDLLENLVILELKAYLEWKVDLDLQVHLVPQDLLETQYLLLLLLWEEVRLWLEHLELLAGKVCLEDLEILVNLVNLDVLEDHTLKMISERFVLQFLETALVS